MELLVFGHHGAPLVVFPTSQGRFYEYEDRGMVGALSEHLERGWLQLYCVDSIDAEQLVLHMGAPVRPHLSPRAVRPIHPQRSTAFHPRPE